MNNKILITSLLLASAFYSNLSFAQLAEAKKELLLDIKEETKKCVIQFISINNKDKDVIGYESTCPSLVILNNQKARILIDNELFSVEVKESDKSDGGDLDDMFIYNSKHQLVAFRADVAAYDSVIMAMAPGVDFRKKVK